MNQDNRVRLLRHVAPRSGAGSLCNFVMLETDMVEFVFVLLVP
jgi:hypothetical protein